MLLGPSSTSVASRLAPLLEHAFGGVVLLRIRAWDGSEFGPSDAPALIVRSRRALRRLLWAPGELGLARAYVAGDIDVEGDIFDALTAGEVLTNRQHATDLTAADRLRLARTVLRLGAVGPPPAPPPEEAHLHGHRHGKARDADAIHHHYDVGNAFYARVLGPSMVYSCAYWERPDDPAFGLADAQEAKCELVSRKLGLEPGMRLLDVGCGWGSMALHAAVRHGVSAVGITLSHEQAALARERVAAAGLEGAVEIRVQDYRDIDVSRDGPFDAISSIGMAEHVGRGRYSEYASRLLALLRPGGKLLNHQIARLSAAPHAMRHGRTFIDAYVFPDGELLPLATVVDVLETTGFEVRHVEALREHYVRTLRCWVDNLQAHWDECVALTSPGRARVWLLYMAGSALAFESGHIGVNQTLAVKPLLRV